MLVWSIGLGLVVSGLVSLFFSVIVIGLGISNLNWVNEFLVRNVFLNLGLRRLCRYCKMGYVGVWGN